MGFSSTPNPHIQPSFSLIENYLLKVPKTISSIWWCRVKVDSRAQWWWQQEWWGEQRQRCPQYRLETRTASKEWCGCQDDTRISSQSNKQNTSKTSSFSIHWGSLNIGWSQNRFREASQLNLPGQQVMLVKGKFHFPCPPLYQAHLPLYPQHQHYHLQVHLEFLLLEESGWPRITQSLCQS